MAQRAVQEPAEPVPARDPKRDNAIYHDAAAGSYDGKWALTFEGPGFEYVRARAEWMLPASSYPRVLEVGCGTGYWGLNLWQAGYVDEAHATDISQGMLAVCRARAEHLGCDIELRRSDAERLPYPDRSFDLVTGHAFLHHLPEPRAALAEMFRALRPGGAVFLAGEPTVLGDRLAGLSKRALVAAGRLAAAVPPLRRYLRQPPGPPATERERNLRDLEFAVDLHTFEPAEVERWTRDAGFDRVRVETEELVASLVGWAVRTFEAEVRPGLLGRRWGRFAYGTWRALYELDQRVLCSVLPKRLFYNLLLYAEKPEEG